MEMKNMGRRKLPVGEKLNYTVGFKVNDELLEKIKNACEKTGETPGTYCRSFIEANIN